MAFLYFPHLTLVLNNNYFVNIFDFGMNVI